MSFTASDVLLKAASRVEEEGMWCQQRFFNGLARCATMHLFQVGQDLGTGAAEDALVLFRQHVGRSLFAFNDAPGRTAYEVAEAMRQAALQ